MTPQTQSGGSLARLVGHPHMTITIPFRVKWRCEAGDGTNCRHCGDASWLIQTRLILIMSNGEERPQEIVICASCMTPKICVTCGEYNVPDSLKCDECGHDL